ncbi:hypothetical protein [Kitasatospora indigofera]|uniref:hypothetical protein n=1 Tax=Kitasatospora indigofera TaxID=67307 RepID=UPI0033A81C7A
MSGSSFQIDLDEVEAAAKKIRTMLDDLEAPAARLEAVIKQIQPTVYGTDNVGKSLTGGTSSVGGLSEHQQQVFEGVKRYLQNSAQLAANLELMCQRYRATDEARAVDLRALDGGRGETEPVPASLPTVQEPPIPQKDPVTLTVPHGQTDVYHDPTAPELDYNERDTDEEPIPRPAPGGAHNQLI